jgi:uncharacterized LabA/DUF88 family protein
MKNAIVYIDGYNLYYSRLKGSAFKWLDVVALFRDHLLHAQLPDAQVTRIRYFSAPALAKFATHERDSVTAQNEYLRALKARNPHLLEIQMGYHVVEHVPMIAYKEPPDKTARVGVWRLEEKLTDVNIALAMYRDAAKGLVDIIVLCTNDSDMVPAIKAIQADFPAIQIGVIAPLPPPHGKIVRRANKELSKLANWSRHYILDEELQKAQLPSVVPTRKKAARKPTYW